MMFAVPANDVAPLMMSASPYDVWLCHIWAANIISLRPSGAISFSRSEYIIFAVAKTSYIFLEETMKENKLIDLSMDFAVDILNLVKHLKSKHETIVSDQIGRSGTSIGANIHEAQYAQGKKDFISKLEIALKETNETLYWLELLSKTSSIEEDDYKKLSSKCTSIKVLLIASCRTAKSTSN